jgi:cytochrome c5
MSDQHHDFPKTTVTQVVLATLGGLFAPLLVIILIVKLVMGIQANHLPDENPVVADAKVEERIAPIAEVDVAETEAGATKVALSGDAVYQQNCFACHGSGAMGAPMLGDKDAWSPRIAQGYETLVKHAIEGLRMMPARGGNPSLSDDEVANAVVYMANEAGANFKAVVSSTADAAPAEEVFEEATAAVVAQDSSAEESAAAPTAASKGGEQTYKATCAMCHDTGLMGAPKPGDKDAWAPRIAQGKDTLIKHAIEGIRMMPARGGNPSLSDEEVAQTVVFMANQSGAGF